MEPAFKAVTDYGILAVSVVVLATVVWYFIRDLRAQRDRALTLAESAINAFDRLTDQLGVSPTVRPQRPRRDDPK